MKAYIILISAILISCHSSHENNIAIPSEYLSGIKAELAKEWPQNRTVNLVFHGHSVPAGYFKTPRVNTLESYPFLLLKELKKQYPYAVINIINTSRGGENSIDGKKRFDDVLTHRPDVLFIDYALNDISIGLEKSREAWEGMIRMAKKKNVKVILLTPSPDQRINILKENNDLEKHAKQITDLSITFGVGLVDTYELFHKKVLSGDDLSIYMSQVNHPNEKGNQLIAHAVMNFFK